MKTNRHSLGLTASLKKGFYPGLNRKAFLSIRLLYRNEAIESSAFEKNFECFIILQSFSQSLTRALRKTNEKQVFIRSISCLGIIVDSIISIKTNVFVVEN